MYILVVFRSLCLTADSAVFSHTGNALPVITLDFKCTLVVIYFILVICSQKLLAIFSIVLTSNLYIMRKNNPFLIVRDEYKYIYWPSVFENTYQKSYRLKLLVRAAVYYHHHKKRLNRKIRKNNIRYTVIKQMFLKYKSLSVKCIVD